MVEIFSGVCEGEITIICRNIKKPLDPCCEVCYHIIKVEFFDGIRNRLVLWSWRMFIRIDISWF